MLRDQIDADKSASEALPSTAHEHERQLSQHLVVGDGLRALADGLHALDITPDGERPGSAADDLHVKSLRPDLTRLVFSNWDKGDFHAALDEFERALEPFRIPLVKELLANASDSIMLDGKSGAGTIVVEIDKSDGIYVSVRDNGQGIHPEVEPNLFQWMPQTPVPDALLKIRMDPELVMGRLGDGLHQLKVYIQKSNGALGYENFGEHNGARFWFKIPAR